MSSAAKTCCWNIIRKKPGSGTLWCCEAPAKFGPVTRALYTDGFHQVFYEINEKAYPRHITSADKILQLFPMRKLLFEKRVFLLHASQAVLEGKGILFTGDSGVGKTTRPDSWNNSTGRRSPVMTAQGY